MTVVPVRRDRITVAFQAFHREHPEVYDLVVQLTREAVRAGRQKVGMKMVWERARWDYYIRPSDDTFKLNNNYTALYARLIMKQEPDLKGVFELRARKVR